MEKGVSRHKVVENVLDHVGNHEDQVVELVETVDDVGPQIRST